MHASGVDDDLWASREAGRIKREMGSKIPGQVDHALDCVDRELSHLCNTVAQCIECVNAVFNGSISFVLCITERILSTGIEFAENRVEFSQIAEGDFGRAICREGGLVSAMWAGPRTNLKKPLRMTLLLVVSRRQF